MIAEKTSVFWYLNSQKDPFFHPLQISILMRIDDVVGAKNINQFGFYLYYVRGVVASLFRRRIYSIVLIFRDIFTCQKPEIPSIHALPDHEATKTYQIEYNFSLSVID